MGSAILLFSKTQFKQEKLGRYGAIPEKIQTGRVEDMEFRDLINRMWKFLGSIQKEVEFPGLIQKKSFGISMSLGF